MTIQETVYYIHTKTGNASKAMPGRVMFGMWKLESGAAKIVIADELEVVKEKLHSGYDVVCTYAEGREMKEIGTCRNEYVVHIDAEVLEKIMHK